MDEQLGIELLLRAMKSPDVVDALWQAEHGTPTDPHGLNACLRLDKLLGGSGKPDSQFAIELSHNAGQYIEFLMIPDQYPSELRARANSQYPPFGRHPEWSLPTGFRRVRGLSWLIQSVMNRQDEAILRRRSSSVTRITIRKPRETNVLYPWQNALGAIHAFRVWDPSTKEPAFGRVSSAYVRAGHTFAYQVCYRHKRMDRSIAVVLIRPGLEQVFAFQTESLAKEKQAFDGFLASLS